MPDNIYGINVGQVEIPSSGVGVRGGGLSPANNSINSLLRFQQRMTELEANKRQKALDNTNLLFQGAVKKRGLGASDNKSFLGFDPNNEYEANVISQVQSAIDDQFSQFAKSDGTNESYANMMSNVNKILSNEDFMIAGATNKRISNTIKDIQERKQDLHPLWYAKLQDYQNAKDTGSYDLGDILNPTKFEKTKVTPKDDYDDFSKMGINLRTVDDKATGKRYIVTDQANINQIYGYVKEKYGKNFGLDFDYLVKLDDDEYNRYLAEADGDVDLAREQYISDAALSMANNYAITEEGTSFQQNLGDTVEEKIRQADMELKDKQTLEKEKYEHDLELEKKKQENRVEYANTVGKNAQENSKIKQQTADKLKSVWGEKTDSEIKEKVDKVKTDSGISDLTDSEIADAISNVNTDGLSESEKDAAIVEEVGKVLISNDKEYITNVKNNIQDKIKKGDEVTYNVLGDTKEQHSLTKERYSPRSSLSHRMGDTPKEMDQTIVRDITDVYRKGGKTIARGTIITKNNERNGRIPSQKEARELTGEEITQLNKEGYNLDTSKKYYEVPVDIEIDQVNLKPTNRSSMIKYLENGGKYVGTSSTGAKGGYQFVDSTGYNYAKRIYPSITKEEYLSRINSDKPDDIKFQDEIFAASELDINKWHPQVINDITKDSAFRDKIKEYVINGIRNAPKNAIKDFTLDSVPNWIIDYMLHHNGGYTRLKKYINGSLTTDVGGMFDAIARGIKKYGVSDINYENSVNDTLPKQETPQIPPQSDTITTKPQGQTQGTPTIPPKGEQKSTRKKKLGDL